jgi:hypothetical protein
LNRPQVRKIAALLIVRCVYQDGIGDVDGFRTGGVQLARRAYSQTGSDKAI